jgi:spore maturation protein CgeB
MRFLIIDTDYPSFLHWLYTQDPSLKHKAYEKQMQVRAESLFACGVSYSSNLRKLGHEAHQIFFNNEALQTAWAREHGLKINTRWQFRLRKGLVPWLSRAKDQHWLYDILTAQIQYYKPDVLLNNAMQLSTAYFRHMKPYVRLLVGSHGSPLPKDRDFGVYDLVLSVVENFVDYFRREGVNSELLRLGFEPLVLERFNGTEPSIPVSFVGQLTQAHASRQHWLEYLCQRLPVQVWMPSTHGLRKDSPAMRCHQGAVWGIEMYEIFHKSLITLNHHIDVADAYAGNGRLFEATGMGTLLVTDWKKNLHEMFEPGKEVVAYRSAEECAEMVQYYLEHAEEREAIARAGQQRTLRDHTYYQRMQEFADIVQKYL